ncbi:MAG: dimethylmenaquinone methyltransferase [Mesorhizobium sp.]|uniref:RraA family protein n=1 Tax=Mesorhizobium sp. TaxID=1871066 RepID=UPI001ACA299A|nr:dimethylmenaquinone methyltransferase [Mesorhizobium sp.]MBN9221260.1 dimethylmenaquinone methyltransferase [Mesorhizobium sp.]
MVVKILASGPREPWSPEIAAWRSIPVAVAADYVRGTGPINGGIRPLRPAGQQPRLFGRALTVLCEPPDFGAVLHALDIAEPGDVLMISAGGNADFAMIGDILGGHFRDRGGVGIVCDGAVRDVGTLARFEDFAVYTRHVSPRAALSAERGAVNLPVSIGGRVVAPGDLVIGDDDGVMAFSPDAAREFLAPAQEKLATEARWISDLANGRSAMETFGILAPITYGEG